MVSRLLQGTGLALLACLASACSRQSVDDYVRKGDAYMAQSRPKEAVIEYRNALQVAPKRGDVRLKDAAALMLVGDTAGALKEYVRAADLLPNDATAQLKAGALLLVAGAFEDAKSRADQSLAIDPKNTAAQILRGNALAGLKDMDQAVEDYQQALAINPASETAYDNIAAIQFAHGRQQDAEATFKKAVEMAPQSVPARLALANFQWVTSRNVEAEQTLKEAIALEPANPSANRAIATFYVSTNRAKEAEQYYVFMAKATGTPLAMLSLADYYVFTKQFDEARKILVDVGQNPQAHDAALIRLAAVEAAAGDRARALSRLGEVLEKRPNDMAARVLVAQLLLASGKRDEALAEATNVVKTQPNAAVAADAYLLIGNIDRLNERPNDAISAYEEVLKRQTRPFAATVALSEIHLSNGALDKAMTYAEQAMAARPKSPEAQIMMIRILLAQKQFERAKVAIDSLDKEFPRSRTVLNLQGDLQSAQGQTAAARASYERAAGSTADNMHALTGLVQLDLASGHAKDAVERVEAAMKMRQDADLMLLAASAYSAAGDVQKTADALTKAIDLDPGRLSPYMLLGALSVREGILSSAEERFRQAVQRDPKSVASNTMLAMLLEMEHRPADAEKQYKNVLAIDPRAGVAANNLAWMYASADRNMDEALQLAQSAVQAMPADPSVNDTLGWIYYKKGFVPQAVHYLELSTNEGPNDPSRQYHLGMAYFRAADFQRSKKSLERALAFNTAFDGIAEAKKTLSIVSQ